MADLAAFKVAPVFLDITEIRSGLGSVGVAYGQSVYLDPTTGIYLPTSGAASGTAVFRGIVTSPPIGFAGNQTMDVADHGYVAGFDLSAIPIDAPVYLSDTPGKLSSTPGTKSVVVGRVAVISDRDISSGYASKLLYIRPTPI